MSVKINKNIIIPAILLIVPVTLILLFDLNAWKNWYTLISEIIGFVVFVDGPIAMCLWHWYRPDHFRGLRWVIPAGILSLAGWVVVAASMWIDCHTGHYPENGFAVACAYVLGWSYIWFFMLPIGTVYLLFRGVLELREAFEKWDISGTAKEWIRNILLALLPPFFLVCAYIPGSVGWGMAGIISHLLYLLAGIILLVYFTRKYIFSKPWRKLKKGFAYLLALLLWFPYMVLPPAAFALRSMERGDIFFTEKSPDPKIEAVYCNDPEFRNQCYAVHIQSFNREVESSPMFHTKASIFQKVKVRWDGNRHFIFESSDVGVINFRYQDGEWTASPESLLILPEAGKPEKPPEPVKTGTLIKL